MHGMQALSVYTKKITHMKHHYSKHLLRALTLGGLCFASLQASAQWKLVKSLEATYASDVTPSGNILLSDYRVDGNGGIYTSTDKGATWEQTNPFGFWFNKYVHFGNYIFAAGKGTCISRSADNGLTWENKFYSDAVSDVLGANVQATISYAMAVHNGKLFVADFCQGGIVYTEDYGETWKATDIESLKYEVPQKGEKVSRLLTNADIRPLADASESDGKSETAVENFYQLADYNGHLYAFGVYNVFVLNDETLTWEIVRKDSNFMAVSTQFGDKLILGRSVQNETFNSPFLLTLDKNGEWGEVQRPEGQWDNNIRALASDDKNIYAGLQMRGIYYTPNAGEKWFEISEGLPTVQVNQGGSSVYFPPMTINPTDDCIYAALYMYEGVQGSGLYRINRSDLPTATGIENAPVAETADLQLKFNGHEVNINAGDAPTILTVWDAAGRMVANQSFSGQSQLVLPQAGVYTYHANCGGQQKAGKFIIR